MMLIQALLSAYASSCLNTGGDCGALVPEGTECVSLWVWYMHCIVSVCVYHSMTNPAWAR